MHIIMVMKDLGKSKRMESMTSIISQKESVFIKQIKEWGEILIGVESKNKYEIYDAQKTLLGYAAETGSGLWSFILRNILRAHRPLEIKIWDTHNVMLYRIKRPFFWFFSDLSVFDGDGQLIGVAHRKFSLINKKYDITDSTGKLLVIIKSPFWRLWSFPLLNLKGESIGVITKRWSGILKEVFTDTDNFKIDFPKDIDDNLKSIILGTAFTIDLDYFEDNNRGRSSTNWNF